MRPGDRLIHLKMRGVFPPERARDARPGLEAAQAVVDRETPAIVERLLQETLDLAVHGEARGVPVGIFGRSPMESMRAIIQGAPQELRDDVVRWGPGTGGDNP